MPANKQTKKTEEVEEKKQQVDKKVAKSESKKAAPAKSESKKAASTKTESKKAPAKTESKKAEKKPVEKKPVEKKPVEKKEQTENEGPKEKKRRERTKESVNGDFETVLKMIQDEIEELRQVKKSKGIRFLKSLNKAVRQLHNDTNHVTKFRKTAARKNNSSSGFLKPVHISADLASFTGWDASKTYSRTEVTKFICEYIKKNKLFDEKGDKRNIVVNAPLQKLLKYDPAHPPKDENGKSLPLTYFRLQQYLKGHFTKPAEEVEELDE